MSIFKTGMSENGTIHISMMKNWVSYILFLGNGGLIIYLPALKKGAMSYMGATPPPPPLLESGRVLDLIDKGVVGLNFSGGTMLCLCAKCVMFYLVLVQPRQRPGMTENFLTGM